MTCIAGLAQDGSVYIGADSAGISGWDLTIRKDGKLFFVGPYLIGCTTSFRMAQLLRYGWIPPAPPDGDDPMEFMCTAFVESVRTRFKEGGFAKKEHEQEEGGDFLVGVNGHLYYVGSDYQVGENEDGFMATGSGGSAANGAMYALAHQRGRLDPREIVMTALLAAEHYCIGVRGPFKINSIPARVAE